MNILDAMDDPQVFAPWFERGDWDAWAAFLCALFGLDMTKAQREVYRACTGRESAPESPHSEGWLIVGRRGGKSFIAALVAVFLACFRDYRDHLQPGERGTVLILAADRKQARTILRYVRALIEEVPLLRPLIERQTAEGIDLTTRVSIEVHTASFRATRGYTVVAALLDEVAFWRSEESANPDREVVNAIRPGMATIPGAMLLGLSSPYSRRGVLYDAYRRHYGQDGSHVLIWQADTRTMNPSVPQEVVDAAYEADPAAAAAEYGAQFRSDLESFVSEQVVRDATVPGRHELPYVRYTPYEAFVDPSGGSRDSMTLAIAHALDDGSRILDCVREVRAPFSPEAATGELCDTLKSYGITTVTGDRYGGEWPRERFLEHGIEYRTAEKPKSDLYRELLPLLNSGKVELLEYPRLAAQLVSLERRTARGGKDSIDHPPGAHDDLANAVAGALTLVRPGDEMEAAVFYGDGSQYGMTPREWDEWQTWKQGGYIDGLH